MEKRQSYPFVETFISPQGEGRWTGTLMKFVRLGGCNVGKYVNGPDRLPQCTLYDGRTFECDTRYKAIGNITVDEIFNTNLKHICITGGEPFLYDLEPIFDRAIGTNMTIHVETSGTKPFSVKVEESPYIWISCAPKAGFLDENMIFVSEFKLLVDENFNTSDLELFLSRHVKDYQNDYIYIQPVNHGIHINKDNVYRCLELQEKYPFLKISMQMHKYWGVR